MREPACPQSVSQHHLLPARMAGAMARARGIGKLMRFEGGGGAD